jgi:hypothetical protein
MKRILIGIATVVLVVAAADKSQDAERQFKAAQNTELVDGDLKRAIDQYKKLSQGSNRAIAARALLRMGGCYEKLGSKEADKQYDLVISKFADQREAVAEAKAHLGGAAAKTNAMGNRRVWSTQPVFEGTFPRTVVIFLSSMTKATWRCTTSPPIRIAR